MNAIIAAVNDEIQHLKKSIEANDSEIYGRVIDNQYKRGRVNQLQYELNKLLDQLPQSNVMSMGNSANKNVGTNAGCDSKSSNEPRY